MIRSKRFATGQGADYTTGCLLGYKYFYNTFKYYKMIAIVLSKQQALRNTANQFYCKYSSIWKYNSVFHY